MKTNSLGYAVEVVPPPEKKTTTHVVVRVDPTEIHPTQPRYIMKTSNMLCCILATLLVSSGIGIGVWFALTPVE